MATDFDGNDSISVTGFSEGTVVTVCFWLEIDTLPGSGHNRPFGTTGSWESRYNRRGKIYSDIWQSGSPPASVVTLTTGTLYHVAMTADSVGNTGDNYINGVLDINTDGTHGGSSGGTTFSMGTRTGSSENIDGRLDDFRIYNRILSAAEILTIYSCRGRDNIYEGLIHRWVMNEGAPGTAVSSVIDLTGNLNGTAVGNPTYAASSLRCRG